MRGYLPFIWKDSSTLIHGLAVYVKEELSFARDLSLGNPADSFNHLLRLLARFFGSILSNIDEVLLINPSANGFVFGEFYVNHKGCLTYSGATGRSSEICYNFSFSNDLTQMVNLSTLIADCDSHSAALSDSFLSFDDSICSKMAFPPVGNPDHVVVSVSIDFPTNS